MPRDLQAERDQSRKTEEHADEVEEINETDGSVESSNDSKYNREYFVNNWRDLVGGGSTRGQAKKVDENAIKPYVQTLTMQDIDSVMTLTKASLPSSWIALRDTIEYRFSKCAELSFGLFTSADTTLTSTSNDTSSSSASHPHPSKASTASTAIPVYSGTPERKSILLAAIIATKSTNSTLCSDDAIAPKDWQSFHPNPVTSTSSEHNTSNLTSSTQDETSTEGHEEYGRTLCIHTMAVLPAFRRNGLGGLLMRSYVQRMQGSGVADRIALVSRDENIDFFENMGFKKMAKSQVRQDGGSFEELSEEEKGWDMVLDFGGEIGDL